MDLLGLFDKVAQIDQWQEQLEKNSKRQLLTGLSGSAKTLALVSTFKKLQKSILVVTPNLYYTNQLVEDLLFQLMKYCQQKWPLPRQKPKQNASKR